MKVENYYKNIKAAFEEFDLNYTAELSDFEGENAEERLNNYRIFMLQKSDELVECLKEYQSFMIKNLKVVKKEVEKIEIKIGEVWRDKSSGSSFVVALIQKERMKKDIENYEFVCEKPHQDGDYSYLCFSQYCKCSN